MVERAGIDSGSEPIPTDTSDTTFGGFLAYYGNYRNWSAWPRFYKSLPKNYLRQLIRNQQFAVLGFNESPSLRQQVFSAFLHQIKAQNIACFQRITGPRFSTKTCGSSRYSKGGRHFSAWTGEPRSRQNAAVSGLSLGRTAYCRASDSLSLSQSVTGLGKRRRG